MNTLDEFKTQYPIDFAAAQGSVQLFIRAIVVYLAFEAVCDVDVAATIRSRALK